MGRYHPSVHESSIKCTEPRCSVKNAPDGSTEYDPECWRCGEPLGGKPQTGDEIVVDIVDLDREGNSVGKTDSGFILFLDSEIGALEARVEVVSLEETSGQAEIIETL